MMMAPISRLPRGLSLLSSFSSTGITKASVLPEPVTACYEGRSESQFSSNSERELQKTRLYDHILVLHEEWDRASLYRSHLFEPHVADDIGTARSRSRSVGSR